MNKQLIIILISILTIVGIVTVTLLVYKLNKQPESYGGSGQLEIGSLILTGYESPSNTRSRMPFGGFFSTRQQNNIRIGLEGVLYDREPRAKYSGAVISESVDVNLNDNVIKFKIRIEKPDSIYGVEYNSLTNAMKIIDDKEQTVVNYPGEKIRPIRQ